ncbi:MAG: HAD-IA family hydrolase [Clostridiaceae bacterium]|nr:HAD-IA family hydrolase [Clostridiaceae bacterium]
MILSRPGRESFFDAVADGTEISRSKPDPEVFLLTAEKLRVSPRRAAVVEDAAAGLEAAKRGGFYAIGIGSAAGCEASDGRIRRLSDLLSIVQGPLP